MPQSDYEKPAVRKEASDDSESDSGEPSKQASAANGV